MALANTVREKTKLHGPVSLHQINKFLILPNHFQLFLGSWPGLLNPRLIFKFNAIQEISDITNYCAAIILGALGCKKIYVVKFGIYHAFSAKCFKIIVKNILDKNLECSVQMSNFIPKHAQVDIIQNRIRLCYPVSKLLIRIIMITKQ